MIVTIRIPAAKFDRYSFNENPIAKPKVPNAVSKVAVWTPIIVKIIQIYRSYMIFSYT